MRQRHVPPAGSEELGRPLARCGIGIVRATIDCEFGVGKETELEFDSKYVALFVIVLYLLIL